MIWAWTIAVRPPSGVQGERLVEFLVERQKATAVAGLDFFLLRGERAQRPDQGRIGLDGELA